MLVPGVRVQNGIQPVRHPVAIVIIVEVVPDSVPIRIPPFRRVQGERVGSVLNPVAVGVSILEVPDTVAVRVEVFAPIRGEGVEEIQRAVVIVVRVAEVGNSVAVRILVHRRSAPCLESAGREPFPDLRPGSDSRRAVPAGRGEVPAGVEPQDLVVVVGQSDGLGVKEVPGGGLHENTEARPHEGRRRRVPGKGGAPLGRGAGRAPAGVRIPQAPAPGVKAAPVDPRVPLEEPGEETGPLGRAQEYDPVVVDRDRGAEPALQEFMEEPQVPVLPGAPASPFELLVEQLGRMPARGGLRRGHQGRDEAQFVRRGDGLRIGRDEAHQPLGGARREAVQKDQHAARLLQIPAFVEVQPEAGGTTLGVRERSIQR